MGNVEAETSEQYLSCTLQHLIIIFLLNSFKYFSPPIPSTLKLSHNHIIISCELDDLKYLSELFNPASLTIPKLHNILLTYGVNTHPLQGSEY